jgi:hypothetical protein
VHAIADLIVRAVLRLRLIEDDFGTETDFLRIAEQPSRYGPPAIGATAVTVEA